MQQTIGSLQQELAAATLGKDELGYRLNMEIEELKRQNHQLRGFLSSNTGPNSNTGSNDPSALYKWPHHGKASQVQQVNTFSTSHQMPTSASPKSGCASVMRTHVKAKEQSSAPYLAKSVPKSVASTSHLPMKTEFNAKPNPTVKAPPMIVPIENQWYTNDDEMRSLLSELLTDNMLNLTDGSTTAQH